MSVLGRKFGPLPAWAWGLGALGAGAFYWYRRRAEMAEAEGPPATVLSFPTMPGGLGGTSAPMQGAGSPLPTPQVMPSADGGTLPIVPSPTLEPTKDSRTPEPAPTFGPDVTQEGAR